MSLEAHRAQLLTPELAVAADLLVVMDHENEAILAHRFPEAQGRLVLLGAFDTAKGDTPLAIADPYGQGVDVVTACYARIARSVAGLAQALARPRA